MEIARLIEYFRPQLNTFDYDHYPDSFAAFQEAAAPFFDSLKDEDAADAARRLADDLENGVSGLGRRDRKEASEQQKQVLAYYLGPSALRRGGTAERFAEALRDEWNRRFPHNRFLLGSFETLMEGFDANLLGLKLRKSKKR